MSAAANRAGRGTIYSQANARARSRIRKLAFGACLVIAGSTAALTGLNFFRGYFEWDFYSVVLLFACSLAAALLIRTGRVTAGAVLLIAGIETILAVEPYMLLGRTVVLAMYLMVNSLGFVINILLAGLLVQRFFILLVTLVSAANVTVVAVLSDVQAIQNSSPFLVMALLGAGCLVYAFHALFLSALDSARAEERQAAALHEQLLQAQKMEAIGRLAGGITHDFNNVLAAIMGQMEIVRRDRSLPERVHARVGEVIRFADKAAGLVQQLLLFSRGDRPAVAPLDLQNALSDLEGMLRRLLGKDVRLGIRCRENLTVRADPSQLQQVVMNLVVNARDAMPQGGRIDIEAGSTAAETAAASPPLPAGRYAFIKVSDTGTGLTPEVRSRLFEPFFTTKPRGQGTGLGLSTVYAIVTGAGGGIAVDSVPGQGSTFCVYLPQV